MARRDWKAWWNKAPAEVSEDAVFQQVGRTVGGRPSGEFDIATTVDAIIAAIRPLPSETILDLCCGNGLISARVSPFTARLIGIDYSLPLIERALQLNSRPNVRYAVCDATDIAPTLIGADTVDAAYMSFSFQYFDLEMAALLFRSLRRMTSSSFRLFLEGVPDEDRLLHFYNTPERVAEYHRRVAEGTEAIGNWWSWSCLSGLAEKEGFECLIIEQQPSRINSHYRYDALLRLATSSP